MAALSRPVRVMGFAGSARRASFNARALRIALRGAERAGAACTAVDLAEHRMPVYDGDLEADEGLPPAAGVLRALLAEHDALLIAAPEYNGSITPLLKNTLDWMSRGPEARPDLSGYRGKVVGLLAASPGPLGGLRGLVHARTVLTNLGCLVLPEQVTLRQAASAFDEAGELVDEGRRAQLEGLGGRVVEVASRLVSDG